MGFDPFARLLWLELLIVNSTSLPLHRNPGVWLGLTSATGLPLLAWTVTGMLSWPLALGLAIVPLLCAVQLARTARNARRIANLQAGGFTNAAIRRYNWRMAVASAIYVVGMMIAIKVYDANEGTLSAPLTFAIAMLPTLPALGMIVSMVRYLIEEEDEFLRHRASLAALIGLGLVLTLGTIWGFLETFGLVINIWAWWVVPVWAIGLGIGQAFLAYRDRASQAHETGDKS